MRTAFSSMRRPLLAFCTLMACALLSSPEDAEAVGDGSTRFNVFVPPNNVSNRDSYLIVTNTSPAPADVSVIDDDADGDDDDSVETRLSQGESYLIRLKDGLVDDDIGGKKDGDYFRIRANHPVVVQMATRSNWQHDWVPGEGKGGLGKSFFVYSPATSGADNDANVYAYSDDTLVTIMDISTSARTATGKTAVSLAESRTVLSRRLNAGEDLITRHNKLGLDILDPGHTYWIQASQPVTVQYGHLGQVTGGNQARDGAGFVPSSNGSTAGSLYYFSIPHNPGRKSEKELRVSCFDAATVSVLGANAGDFGWSPIAESPVSAGGHFDLTGKDDTAFRDHDLYKLTVSPSHHRCTVFEGNWMETGSFGTSDFASALSAQNGENLGHVFQAYVGPPGKQENVAHPDGESTNNDSPAQGFASHLYVYALNDATSVTVQDSDGEGRFFDHTFTIDKDEYYDVVVDKPTYQAITRSGDRPYFSVRSSAPVMVMNGNFNDNWMAFFHSVGNLDPVSFIDTSEDALTCGQSFTVTARCGSRSADETLPMTASIDLPVEVSAPVLPPGASQSGSRISFPSQQVDANGELSLRFQLRFPCESTTCIEHKLKALTLECETESAGVRYASLATSQLQLIGNAEPKVTRLQAFDVPDYESAASSSRVELEFDLDTPSPATVTILRSVNSPDPDASQLILDSFSVSSGTSQHRFEDPYGLHYEGTRYYRVQVSSDSCVVEEGPISIATSSGMSSGLDSGLESHGTLSQKLARRAISRKGDPSAIEPSILKKLTSRGIMAGGIDLDRDTLSGSFPDQGPMGSAPVNATPGDLPALTNAQAVMAADYLAEDGTPVASVLVVETIGATYEHSKALCDRAGGGHLDLLEESHLPSGSLLRFATRNETAGTGEYVVPFKLYGADDTAQVFSSWLAEDYPDVNPDQRILNFQVWSDKPGIALTLAEDILAHFGVESPVTAPPPSSYFTHAGTLGQRISVETAGDPAIRLRRTLLLASGETQVEVFEEANEAFLNPHTLFVDATLEIIDDSGQALDRVWMSDGAWALMDDRLEGGTSTVESQSFQCPSRTSESSIGKGSVLLSGCARVEANVAEYAGVARHIGGAFAPLALTSLRSMSLTLRNSEAVEICLHSAAEDTRRCRDLQPREQERKVSLNLNGFVDQDCQASSMADLAFVSILSKTPGPIEISASELTFHPEATADTPLPRRCEGKPSDGFSPSPNGCGCSTPGAPGRGSPAGLLGLAILIWGARRTWRARTHRLDT